MFFFFSKSREAAPGAKELSLAEHSKADAGVVYCFKPSVPNKTSVNSPIPAQGAIMPLFAEAVAPHCPHQ